MNTLPGYTKVYADSTGKQIVIGDKIRFRGRNFTLKAFGSNTDFGVATLIFNEPMHTEEIPNETSVYKI